MGPRSVLDALMKRKKIVPVGSRTTILLGPLGRLVSVQTTLPRVQYGYDVIIFCVI